MEKIKITCNGSKSIPLGALQNFQGNLKELRKPELEKLKRSILKHGFSFPVFIWGSKILDGHQRVFATKSLIKDGYSIEDIPVVEIHAESAAEAAEKLLVLNSRYAEITDEGLYEFLAENELDIRDFSCDLSLPAFDMESFIGGCREDGSGGEVETGREEINEIYAVYIECSDESEQLTLLERLNGEGLKCRALIS